MQIQVKKKIKKKIINNSKLNNWTVNLWYQKEAINYRLIMNKKEEPSYMNEAYVTAAIKLSK